MNIALPCHTKDGFEVLEAELLPAIAPHLAGVATFALHRGLPTDPHYKGHWFVSNLETGHWVEYDYKRARAIRRAAERLAKKSPSDLLTAYRKLGRSDAAPSEATQGEK